MKRHITIAFLLLGILLALTNCKDDLTSKPSNDANQIRFLKAELGGCNDEVKSGRIQTEEELEDTVSFSFSDGKLFIHAGLNYLCCAPFKTNCHVKNDSLFITITDVCPAPYESCYCRCTCYYTFDFSFDNILKNEYYYQVILKDPKLDNDIIFKSGLIEIDKL
jgi:hypothetical protein